MANSKFIRVCSYVFACMHC